MGRSKFPGKPSKHVNRKRINVLPATSDTFIECSQSLTVETAVENKQGLSECMVNDNANIKNTLNISKVSLRKRLNRKLQNSKNVLNSSSSKRNLISKICNKTNNRTINNKNGRQTNINRKSLHSYSMKNINKQQRKNNIPKETNNSIVGKFVLPTRSVHSSRVIKPNKRFINVDLSDTLTFKKKTVNSKQNCEKNSDDSKKSNSDNKTSISEKAVSTTTPTTASCSSSSSSSSSSTSSSNIKCNDTTAATTTSSTKSLQNGRIVLRQARLKLHSQTTISNSDGPFSSNLTNNSPPGTVTCGVCGAVRFYRFVKQARKFNIYSCESCRKFISKMIKRQNCGKNTSNSVLVCHKGQGMCHVPPVVRNQQMKVVRCGYKARCPACWLKMCLRSFQMPMSLKHSLAQLLPKYMQGSDVMFSNSLPLLWQMSNKLNNQITNDNIDNQNDTIKQRPVRFKNSTTTTTTSTTTITTTSTKSTTSQSLQINADIKRQKIDLKGPRVKHVCRSASIVLGQPQATFPMEIDKIDKGKNDIKEQKKIETKQITSIEDTKCTTKTNKIEQNPSENELSDSSDKNPTKLQYIINDNIINFKRDKFKLPENKVQNEKRRIRHELQSNTVCFDYYDNNYDTDDINHNGFCLISSQQFPIIGICFLCGSGGREKLLYCSLCCEPYHPYCLEQLPLINNNNNNNNDRQFVWLCPKCTKCTLCNQSERQKINCQMCSKTYHPECLDIKWNGSNQRSNVCSECLTCKNCKNQITNLNGNLQFCIACLKVRKESNICTLCLDTFKEDVDELIMECTNCHKWVHVKCEGLSEEYFQILTLLPEKLRYICRLCSKEITPYWRKLVDAELNFKFNQVVRLLSKNKIARNILKLNPLNKQKNQNRLLIKRNNDNSIVDNTDGIDDIDDGIANLENININNDNTKNSQMQCNYDLENTNNLLTIQDIRNKLNSNQYNSLKEFDNDMEEILNKINSLDLIKIYRSILNSVFPWYNKQTKNLQEPKFPIQKQHTLTDTIINYDNNCSQIDNNIVDTRYCQLCRNIGDGYSESRLLYCGQNEWVHANCAFWSDEVYEEIDGSLQNVHNAINRGRITRCTYCKQKGATLSCSYKNCTEIYHFICGKNSNCTFMNDKKIYCLNHLQLFKTNNQITNFQLNRTMFVELTNNDNDREKYYPIDKVNIMIGSLRITNLGKINPLVSDNVDVLIPTGYVCTRLYWSTIEPWKLVNYKITTSIINGNTNISHIDRNFTVDHTLSRTIVERKLREVFLWQKDIDRKRTDLLNDFDDDDDEPQNGAADLLSPEITDAIFEELPHELLDGISVQDIFPKLMTNYEDFVSNDTNNKIIDNSNDNNDDNYELNSNKNQRSCSLTLSCKLDNTFSPVVKKRKIAPPRENNLFFQLLQVDGTFDDSGSSDCESPNDNIDNNTTNLWNNCSIEEPVTCERCHCTYRTKASYKRHLDSCELICSSESDSEINQEQDCINIDTTLQNSHLNIMEKCSTVVINETTQQPIVLTTSFESYQNEIHTAVLNTHQTFVSSKSAELITVPQSNGNTVNNTPATTNNNNIFISPITQTSIDSNQQPQNETFTVNRCSTVSVNESIPIQNNQQFCINQTVPICVNPSSLTLQSNSTIINQNNQLLNQAHLEYQPSVTIPVCYSNNLQPIINVTPQNHINFTNNKLIAASNSIVTQGININNTINVNQSNRWTKPVGKPAVFTKSQQKLKNSKSRTIIAKRHDDIDTIIIPTTSIVTTTSSLTTTTTAATTQPTMIVQHLPSTTNFIPTFVDTFPQNNQNLQYLTTITTPQINPQPLVQLQTDNNIISLLPGMQPTTMIIQQQPPPQQQTARVLENHQFVLDSNGSLSWATPQQITTTQPIYYGFETIVQNTIMQSQQFLPTTVPGVLTANSSYSTTTQVFQTSKLEPVIADVTANSFVLLNPGQLMNQSIQVSQQQQQYQQPQINNNLSTFLQHKNLNTTTTATIATTKLSSCPVKYNTNNNTNTTTTTSTNSSNSNISTNLNTQKHDKPTVPIYVNNNANITLPTSPFVSDHGIPTNIVTPTPKINNNNNNNSNNNNNNINNNINQSRPMSRVLPMQSIKDLKVHSNKNNNNNNAMTTTIATTTITTTTTTTAATSTIVTASSHNINNNSNSDNIINNNNNNNNHNDKVETINKLIKDMKSAEVETKSIDKIKDNDDKIILNNNDKSIDDEIVKSEPIKMIFQKQTEDGTYKISSLFDKTNLDNEKLDFVTKINNSNNSNNNINNNNNNSNSSNNNSNNNNNNNNNSTENTFKLSNFTKNSPVAPLKPIKSNCTSQMSPLCDKQQNENIIDKKIEAPKKQHKPQQQQQQQHQQQQEKKDENSSRILYTIETQDGFKYSSTSIADMWTKLFEAVQNARIANNMPPLPTYYNNYHNNLKLLGLKSPSLKYLIEQLPGVNKCTKYKPIHNFSTKLNDIDDEPVGHNYGCIKCVPNIKSNNNNYDMFGWLASKHRRPEPNLNCTDLVPRRSSINNLPMAMKFRQLKSTSKYSVGVYRSKIHRRGLFCLRDFEAGEMVIEYSGEVIRSILTDKREKYYNSKGIGCYMFRIDDNLVVDATMKGNAARFINHSCDPNCYSKVVEILGHKHIIIFALRRIICGEELTYDYKFPIEEDKIPCTCGTKKCRKFLN